MLEYLANPSLLLNTYKHIFNWFKIRRIRKYAPSAKKVSLIITLKQDEYDALPDNLKKDDETIFLINEQKQ